MCGRARQSRTRLEAASRENAARRETGIDVSPCAGERLNSPCPWVCRAPPAQAAAGSARPPPRPAPSPAPSGASPGPPRQTASCKQSVLLPLAVAGSDPRGKGSVPPTCRGTKEPASVCTHGHAGGCDLERKPRRKRNGFQSQTFCSVSGKTTELPGLSQTLLVT